MQTFDGAFRKELRKIASEKVNGYMEMLASNTYTTVAEFRFLMGKIAALRDLEEMMDEAQRAADQRNR
jgi:hypothetical protein